MSFVRKTIAAAAVGGVAAGVIALAMTGSAGAGVVQTATADPVLRAAALAQEHRTAACMSQRGFTYQVALPNDVLVDEAFQAAVAAGKKGEELHAAIDAVQNSLPPDPNDAVVAQLPAARAAAWSDSLAGTDTAVGCGELAVTMTPEELARLEADTAAGEAAVAAAPADPAVQAAQAGYVACMGAQGYTVADTTEIDAIIDAQESVHRPAESEWPEPLPADATMAQRAAHAAALAKLNIREHNANAVVEKGNTAHETCVEPYDAAVAAAYERLTP